MKRVEVLGTNERWHPQFVRNADGSGSVQLVAQSEEEAVLERLTKLYGAGRVRLVSLDDPEG